MESWNLLPTATAMLHKVTSIETTRYLLKNMDQDPTEETINIEATLAMFQIKVDKQGIDNFRESRIALISFFNFLMETDLCSLKYTEKCIDPYSQTFRIQRWWYENSFRIRKYVIISTFLEGRNLGSFGVTELKPTDIPQSLPLVFNFVKLFTDNKKLIDNFQKRHLECVEKTPEIERIYTDKENLLSSVKKRMKGADYESDGDY